jgi:hypothetical protein
MWNGSRPSLYPAACCLFVFVAGFCCWSVDAQEEPDSSRPITFVMVNLQNWLDAGSIKPGRAFSATAINNWETPNCTIVNDAKVYGHVVDVAKTSKDDKSSSMTLVFDAADCLKKGKLPLPLMVVEVIGPNQDPNKPLLGSMPQEIQGGSRQISQVDPGVAEQSSHANLDSGPINVQAGAVLRIPNVRLTLATGADGASKFTGTGSNIRLVPGVTFILTTTDAAADLNKPQSSR